MNVKSYRWIGRGVYTTSEAARLTGISPGRIRRWIKGYSYLRSGRRRMSPPIIAGDYVEVDDESRALTFRDLIELMCVHGFLQAGVKWPLLRSAHERAAEVLNLDHPFATRKFLTDSHTVLMQVRDKTLLDLVSSQYALRQILGPYLKTDGLDFVGAFAARWWPMGKRSPIVIDGGRSFGQPVVTEGIPTLVLYQAYGAEERARLREVSRDDRSVTSGGEPIVEKTVRYVASWYDIASRSVRAAVEYETRLAA